MNAMQLDQLLNVWEKLAERERLCFMTIGMRLLAGQRKFGPLTLGKKNWEYESLEECLDSSIYLAAALNDSADLAFANAVKDAEDEVTSAIKPCGQ